MRELITIQGDTKCLSARPSCIGAAWSLPSGLIYYYYHHHHNHHHRNHHWTSAMTSSNVFQTYAALQMRSSSLPTFPDNPRLPHLSSSRPVKMGPIGRPETSVTYYHSTRRKVTAERRSVLLYIHVIVDFLTTHCRQQCTVDSS
jgi:hypothetical protein